MARPAAPDFPLLAAAYAPSTIKRYHDAAHAFFRWLGTLSITDPLSPDDFDDYLTHYIHFLYYTDQARYRATHAVYGVISLYPRLRLHLATAKQALRGWGRRVPQSRTHP
jgi:hypothetical protein